MQIDRKPRILLVGLGAVGRAVGAALVTSARCEVIGAVDQAVDLTGRPLASVISEADAQATIFSSIADAPHADVAFVATTSFIEQVEPIITELLERGSNVVSICEELGFGFYDHEHIAGRLDKAARQAGLTILGTGCNPGILMDTLPLVLTSLTLDVKRVHVQRTADMSGYGAILSKFGFGLTEDEFALKRERQTVIGHVGFRESIAALADGLGWDLDEIVVDEPKPVLVTQHRRVAAHMTLGAGTVAVIRHAARGKIDGQPVIETAIDFGIFESTDPFPDGDAWRVESDFQAIEFSSSRIDSYLSTIAVAANVIPSVCNAPPGLRITADLPARSIASNSGISKIEKHDQHNGQ